MPWAKLDDRMPWSRKIQPLSDAAFRLYVTGIAWCAAELTDGFISDDNVALLPLRRNRKAAAGELVERKLWTRTEGGYMVHDFLEYNRSAARMQQERKARNARQQAFRDRSNGVTNASLQSESNGVTEPPHNGVSNASPSRPVPSRPNNQLQADAAALPPKRKPRAGAGSKHETADALTDAFWERHKSNTAQTFIAVRSCIRTAITNGIPRDELAHALDQLVKDGKPISGGTITYALGNRRNSSTGGHQSYRNPEDAADYLEGWE